MAERKKAVTAVTPKGTAVGYQSLNTPDTKFKKEGQFKTRLALDADDAGLAKLRETVEQLLDQKHREIVDQLTSDGKAGVAKKITKRDLDEIFKPEEDEATGEETGRILITAKMTASGVGKKGPWTRSPGIFDAKGKKLKKPPLIGSGSELKLSLELFPYYAPNDKEVGVSFRLEAVQVIKLVSRGARDAAGYGFGEEDGDEIEDGDDTGSDFTSDASGDEDDDL